MKKSNLVLTITLILLQIGSLTAQETNKIKELMPLALGNEWTYEVKKYDRKSLKDFVKSTFVSKVTVDSMFFGQRIFGLNYIDFDTQENKSYLFNKEDGLYSCNLVSYINLFKYPTQKGETYPYHQAYTFKVSSIDSVVKVKAGTFTCVLYTFELSKFVAEINKQLYTRSLYFYCPGVGRVLAQRWEREKRTEEYKLVYSEELTKYHIK